MGKVKKSKVCKVQYAKENVSLALEKIKQGQSIAATSREYGVPETTLRDKIKNKYSDKKPGPSPVISEQIEKELVDWIVECFTRGFPITKIQLFNSVQLVCVQKKMKTPFVGNKPGKSWFQSFLKRHPELSQRMAENVSLSRALVSEDSLRKWFEEISQYLESRNLMFITPSRIFNCDETGVSLNVKPKTVLALRGAKDVYNVVGNNEKENISVLITGSAAGELAPTFILFKGKKLPKNAAMNAPDEFSFGCSDNGWMLAQNFFEFIANKFEPWLTMKKIERPVILYVDGHSSHLTLNLSKFCNEKQIVLIALHPNATHILQPLDVSFFKPLKNKWQEINRDVCEKFASIGITKHQFAPLLKKTLDAMDVKTILQKGFKKCGLYPFDVDAVDFKKSLRKPELERPESTSDNHTSQSTDHDSLKTLEKFIPAEKLEVFRSNAGPVWVGAITDTSLFNVWYNARNSTKNKPYSVLSQSNAIVPNKSSVSNTLNHGYLNEESLDAFNVQDVQNDAESSVLFEFEYRKEDLDEDSIISIDLSSNSVSIEKENVLLVPNDILSEKTSTMKESFEPCRTSQFEAHVQPHQADFQTDVPNDLTVQSTTNYDCKNILKTVQTNSDGSIKPFLSWPSVEIRKNKSKKTRSITKLPSIVSGNEWKLITEQKENEKKLKTEQVAARKQIKLEKSIKLKVKKEADRVRKEKEGLSKEQLKLEKEKGRLLQLQQKIKKIEKKCKLKR